MNTLTLGAIVMIAAAGGGFAEEVESYLTFDNRPLGSESKPLVMRTYLPNPDLDPDVLSNHGTGRNTPRYSAKTGVLSTSSEDKPIKGIPAGIAVNVGSELSYVWDTTECRLLYAWNNGFLDMTSYWGSPERGSRKKNDYTPRLVGNLFYKAKGSHPLTMNEKPVQEISYQGHQRIKGVPIYTFLADGHEIQAEVEAGPSAQTLRLSYHCKDESVTLGFKTKDTAFEVTPKGTGSIEVLVRPNASGSFTGYQKEEIKIKTANASAGEKLYTNFGCSACHTTDGSRNHGPSFQGLSGSTREFLDETSAVADQAYLVESIKNPNAKQVKGFPAGMMPAYPLDDKQIESLVLYIQSLK